MNGVWIDEAHLALNFFAFFFDEAVKQTSWPTYKALTCKDKSLTKNITRSWNSVKRRSIRPRFIWLHGFTVNSGTWVFATYCPNLSLPDELGVKLYFHNAPIRPVTLNNGMGNACMVRQFKSMDMGVTSGSRRCIDSAQRIEQRIRAEMTIWHWFEKNYADGFSQGGVPLHCI